MPNRCKAYKSEKNKNTLTDFKRTCSINAFLFTKRFKGHFSPHSTKNKTKQWIKGIFDSAPRTRLKQMVLVYEFRNRKKKNRLIYSPWAAVTNFRCPCPMTNSRYEKLRLSTAIIVALQKRQVARLY